MKINTATAIILAVTLSAITDWQYGVALAAGWFLSGVWRKIK
jgi:hypothetical protein